ncbi:MAG: hypothetical protein JST00_06815 [Deltaproteobacteria bacterium]|nr:hypothetical protein [Deltaproteobacteria bacterium]
MYEHGHAVVLGRVEADGRDREEALERLRAKAGDVGGSAVVDVVVDHSADHVHARGNAIRYVD